MTSHRIFGANTHCPSVAYVSFSTSRLGVRRMSYPPPRIFDGTNRPSIGLIHYSSSVRTYTPSGSVPCQQSDRLSPRIRGWIGHDEDDPEWGFVLVRITT